MDRRASITAGVLLIAGVLTSLLSTAVLGDAARSPILGSGGSDWVRIAVSVLLQLVTAAGAVGIAIAISALIRRSHPALAVGAVAFRAIEAAFYALSSLCLVGVAALAEHDGAAAGSSLSTADAVLAVRDAANYVFGVFFFGVGAVLYFTALHRERLVPRWLTIWGFVGIALIVSTALVTLIDGAPYAIDGVLSVLALPIAVQELTLGGWLISRGVRIDRSSGRNLVT